MVGPIGVVGGSPSAPSQGQPLGVFTPAPSQQVASPQCPSPVQNGPAGVVSFPPVQVEPPPPNEAGPGSCCPSSSPNPGSGPGGNPFAGIAAGQILFMGLDGQVMGSVNLTFDQINNIFRTQIGEFKGPSPWADVQAWGAVGDGVTDDSAAIQAAADSLILGGTLFFPPASYSVAAAVVMPDINLKVVAPGATILPVGDISVFEAPDGLSAPRYYTVEDLVIQGDPTKAQSALQLDDSRNFGNFVIYRLTLSGCSTFVQWSQYDLSYSSQSVVYIYNSHLTPIVGNSQLAVTPLPGQSYGSATALKATDTSFGQISSGGQNYGWFADADTDLWTERCSYFYITGTFTMNGNMANAVEFITNGSGTVSFTGNGWDVSDYFTNSYIIGFSPVGGFGEGDVQLILFAANVQNSLFISVGLKALGQSSIFGNNFLDAIVPTGSAYPAVRVTNQKSNVWANTFRGVGASVLVWPQGGVVLDGSGVAGAVRCKVYDNFFESVLSGHTVQETSLADFNIIHDNTGYYVGLGPLIVGGNTIEHNNIN